MSYRVDPERNEIKALLEFTGNLEGKRIIEIGAGIGRLTWLYAGHAGEVVCIEPQTDRVARARENMPEGLQNHVAFLETTIEAYQHGNQAPLFDVALMSWSL